MRLFPYHDEGTLREFLERLSGKPVNLALTDNVSSMLSIRQKGQGVTVRLQKIFSMPVPTSSSRSGRSSGTAGERGPAALVHRREQPPYGFTGGDDADDTDERSASRSEGAFRPSQS
ncbi:MAG: hypothetical protein MZU91_05215 [Desulfosudis oleivorans]|nr:hypothetical protein [Desulfosudis oleivorans]